MAESLSHKFGQIIGDLLELALQPHLQKFADEHKLFLDKKGSRIARPGKKVSWFDGNNNKHDLDFVIERGGSEEKIGVPVAFIESAWRRYTKHSRNKAQEIQSAIIPLANKYHGSSPFIGVHLAGEFTSGALTQLESLNFAVLYFPYSTVIRAFAKFDIDASFTESTEEAEFRSKIDSWNALPDKSEVAKELMLINKTEVDNFLVKLMNSILRFIDRIIILPLHGNESIISTATEAIDFISKYEESTTYLPVRKYEIIIRYNTGDRIEASFINKNDAIGFLQTYI